MAAIAKRISNELLPLPEKDQEEVLHEVWERLHDIRAKKIHDAILLTLENMSKNKPL